MTDQMIARHARTALATRERYYDAPAASCPFCGGLITLRLPRSGRGRAIALNACRHTTQVNATPPAVTFEPGLLWQLAE
jgi:hypothetical protein